MSKRKFELKPRKSVVLNKSTTQRNFEYAKGTCTLKFSLLTNTPEQLKDFKDLLETAIRDINEELERFTN